MNQQSKKSSTQLPISKPNPPTAEAIQRAQFVDKTYIWKNAGIRPGDRRTTK
jgi:hypothetical protein